MVDNNENIFVEFDNNNVSLIDPNKVFTNDGKIKERNVNHENLVMYANLECSVLPRTKLALGVSNDDRNQTITVGSINFLKQGDKSYLDNEYTDELTGKGSLKGQGVNQVTQREIPKTKKGESFYIRQSLLSNGEDGGTDNGLLGITSISIRQGLDFLPTIKMTMEDIKGRAMFEGGDSSPYAAFFNLPYPKFFLTIKGFYGKAVKLPLMLQSFTSRYDTGDGNFKIDLTFYTYKYTILSEIQMGSMLAVPHMYSSRIQIQTNKNSSTQFSNVEDGVVELGYQKIKELYGEYKSKGLISDDFPELTLMQLKFRLEQFIKNTLDTFTKENLDPLSDITKYLNNLEEYKKEVFLYVGRGKNGSWFNRNMDIENYFVLNDASKTKVYTFRKELRDPVIREKEVSNLKGIITKFNDLLNSNDTLGVGGSYVIGGKPPVASEIKVGITYDTFLNDGITTSDIDWGETFQQLKGREGSEQEIINFANEETLKNVFNNTELDSDGKLVNYFYSFEGKGEFMDITNEISKQVRIKKDLIQDQLTESLAELLKDKGNNGIGFIPTIRNVLAVVFANGEAFLRLMDDTHRKAWNLRDDRDRKNAIFNDSVANANPDNLNSGENTKNPVYPWPQFIVASNTTEGGEKYEIAYPGDSNYTNITKGYRYDVWPEVEFVEEYLRGLTQRGKMPTQSPVTINELFETNRVSLNAIEFPIDNDVYQNKEKVKYFYEIFERVFLASNYTGLSRVNGLLDSGLITNIISDIEKNNVLDSLSNDNPFLIQDLKNLDVNSDNFLDVLRAISNDGQGLSWNNLIRGIFNTGYIKNDVENGGFEIWKEGNTIFDILKPLVSVVDEDRFDNFLNSTKSNIGNFVDTYPFTDLQWMKGNLQNGIDIPNVEKSKNTTKTLFFNDGEKVISNFKTDMSKDEVRPYSNVNFKDWTLPTGYESDLSNFYFFRNPAIQLPTEGDLNYYNYSGLVRSDQTVSMLNTPYFINSLQETAEKIRNVDDNPFKVPAYLFLNSLPLATLREKFVTYSGGVKTDLDYIFSTIKKFGGIHRVPYAWILKLGSEWHRYKTYVETNVDILDGSWTDFNENDNYDPITSSPDKKYNLNINGSPYEMVMEETTPVTYTLAGSSFTKNVTMINTGFYPKLINDFTLLYEGREIFSGYTDSDIQLGIDSELEMTYVQDSVIDYTNILEDIKVVPWSVFYNSVDGSSSFLVPSNGSLINQTKNECIDGSGVMKFDIKNNQSMYNGSVRLFWEAPNYGYFDNSKVIKPEYNQHIKKVYSDNLNTSPVVIAGSLVSLPSQPQNFSINGVITDYDDISEMFSAFEKDVMDQFESEFLNFSKTRFELSDDFESLDLDTLDGVSTFNNFHLMFIEMFKLPKVNLTNGDVVVRDTQNFQTKKIVNYIAKFLEYDVIFKYGNPGLFDKKLFYTFSNNNLIVDGYTWNQYSITTPNALPTSTNSVTVASSKLIYPNEWRDLELYVGFSDIPDLVYDNDGSYITDFFIDNNVSFESTNIINLSPIIKIYATQKLKDPTMNSAQFKTLMDEYLGENNDFQGKIINGLFTKLRNSLPDVDSSTSLKKKSVVEGDQTKVEIYESFKALNDKWIAGNDFSSKSLFEDVLMLDRASRDVGDKVFIDIYKLKNLLSNIETSPKVTMLTFVKTILIENNFVVMNIPSYVNFYNVQDVVKNATPKPDDSLDMANTLFGTFTNVDYRDSSSKLVCFYANKPSSVLNLKDRPDYRFKSDSFDFSKSADHPLLDDETPDKDDHALSNRVVGFNVDIGPQNQSLFYSFRVAQDPGKATIESLEVENEMANLYGNRGASTQNLSLYNLYKNRSYSCVVSMMGNALIQPTMYFNLKHVPMFSGPYMIQTVDHNISPGTFETIVGGVRQPMMGLGRIKNYLQTLRANLLNSIIEKNKDRIEGDGKTTTGKTNTNIITQKSGIVNDLTKQPNKYLSNTNNCQPNFSGVYSGFNPVPNPIPKESSYRDAKYSIENIVGSGNDNLKYVIFASMYLASNQNNQLISYNNNFSGIDIGGDTGWSQGLVNKFMSNKSYYCTNSGDPYVSFNSIDDNVGLLNDRWVRRVSGVDKDKVSISKFLILNSGPKTLENNVYSKMLEKNRKKIEKLVNDSIYLYDSIK